MEPGQAQAGSLAVGERLFATAWWREAPWVFVYVAMGGEVDTAPIVTRAAGEGKRVAIPRMEGGAIVFYSYAGRPQELVLNRFGIREPGPDCAPAAPLRLKEGPLLVLCPGLAFARGLRRLGRGKGYYDRFLARARGAPQRCLAVGLACAAQLVEEVPAAAWDARLDGLVTDREVVAGRACSPALP